MSYDAVVVGAGFAGSVMAERLARKQGKRVLVLDRRPHVGGNAYDEPDAAGSSIHRYGPHIFHTNSAEIVDYLSAFTEWRPYEHRVLACVRGQLVPIPINRTTVNRLFGLGLKTDDERRRRSTPSRAEPVERKRTSEDVVVGAVGRELYELFFAAIPASSGASIRASSMRRSPRGCPTRTNDDDRYFTDQFQLMPADGYTAMFERMLDHPGSRSGRVSTSTTSRTPSTTRRWSTPVQSTRSSDIASAGCRTDRCASSSRRSPIPTFQPTGTVNYPDETAVPYTRISEFKYITGQQHDATTIVREFPQADRRSLLPDPPPRERRRCTSATGPSPTRRPASTSSAGWRPTSTTTWTRWSARRWRPSGKIAEAQSEAA